MPSARSAHRTAPRHANRWRLFCHLSSILSETEGPSEIRQVAILLPAAGIGRAVVRLRPVRIARETRRTGARRYLEERLWRGGDRTQECAGERSRPGGCAFVAGPGLIAS